MLEAHPLSVIAAHDPGPLRLEAVPPVLLSECFGDFKAIAEAGSGHDPQWKKNIDYWGD